MSLVAEVGTKPFEPTWPFGKSLNINRIA